MISLGLGFWASLLALAAMLIGGQPTIVRIDTRFSCSEDTVTLDIVPVILVRNLPNDLLGNRFLALGPVIWWNDGFMNQYAALACEKCKFSVELPPVEKMQQVILEHELRHVEQFKALGPFMPVFGLLGLPLEGATMRANYEDIVLRNKTMWVPPPDFPWLGYTFRITLAHRQE